jgi:serine phosphatase RsbU (regulator of sigma subunit)
MAKLSADVRYALASEPTVAKAVRQINTSFIRSGWEDRFVTFVLTVLRPGAHEVTIVNAGHMPPFLRLGDGRVESVADDISGIPLGIDENYEYESTTVPLGQNQFMAAFTDGFSEALNAKNELYGLERLRDRIGRPVKDVAALGHVILDDIKNFVGGHPQSDDMCLVCFGRV